MRSSSGTFVFLLLLVCLLSGNEVTAQHHADLCKFTELGSDPEYVVIRHRRCNDRCQKKYGYFVLGWVEDGASICSCFKRCHLH
ncbi:unnamed protein product [Linum trigynum]|uniref:Uncharacterized protein n=1 Tax=Linum trigynum TaxID=586398 RepID=A0AAV2FJI9_9ROSI